MFFETAGIEVALWVPPLVAFAISFFTSMGGVSGAFLLLPFQMSVLGYTHPSVSATNQLFNVVAIPSGVYRYARERRMVWPLTCVVVAGTLPGVLLGAFVRVTYLPDPARFKLFAAAVLLYMGFRMALDLVRPGGPGATVTGTGSAAAGRPGDADRARAADHEMAGPDRAGSGPPPVEVTRFDLRRLSYRFGRIRCEISFWGVTGLSFLVGMVGGVYGIGGGSIIAPLLVSMFRLPVHTVPGAALTATFVTSLVGVITYQALAPFYPGLSVAPDWALGFLFGAGGMAGMYLGARCQKRVPAAAIEWMLAGIMTLTAASYVADFFGS